MIRIAIVDDHPLFREGVRRSLAEQPGFEVAGEGASAADALDLVTRLHPDVLLMDISMPGNGLQAVAEIAARAPETGIVLLTVSERNEHVSEALRLGARGYLLKGIGAEGLAEAIEVVARGGTYVAPTLSAHLFLTSPPAGGQAQAAHREELTARERDVLSLVASGLSNKRIALSLDLNEKTVKHHMTRIMAKLGVQNRTEAALAFRGRLPQQERPARH